MLIFEFYAIKYGQKISGRLSPQISSRHGSLLSKWLLSRIPCFFNKICFFFCNERLSSEIEKLSSHNGKFIFSGILKLKCGLKLRNWHLIMRNIMRCTLFLSSILGIDMWLVLYFNCVMIICLTYVHLIKIYITVYVYMYVRYVGLYMYTASLWGCLIFKTAMPQCMPWIWHCPRRSSLRLN